MLIKKDNNASAQLIPLTTAFAMFRSSKAYDGKATMSLQPMLSTEKVYFPGNNALVIGQHQTYNTETHDFSGINQAINASYGSDGGSDSWGQSVNLTAELFQQDWYKEFNRISNWCDYSQYPNNESANYYSGATSETVALTIPNIVERMYSEDLSRMAFDIVTEYKGTIVYAPRTIANSWNASNNVTVEIDMSTFGTDMDSRIYFVVTATNNNVDPATYGSDSQFYKLTGYMFANSAVRNYVVRAHPGVRTLEFVNDWSNRASYYMTPQPIGPFGTSVNYNVMYNEVLYCSAFTAAITNYKLDNPPLTLTGDDLFFHFDTTGDNVTGTVMKLAYGDTRTNVTADVEYTKIINNTTAHNVQDYTWGGTTGTQVTVGGGGGYSYGMTGYLPYANINLANPTDMSTVRAISDYQGFRMTSKNNIPDTYGGAMLFSGNNLNQYFNQNDKFYCIGFKGVSYYANGDEVSAGHNSCNWEGKLYKFNDEHFKKINNDTFVFFDDEISKIYTTFEANHSEGVKDRKFAPIGPFFMQFTGYTYVNDRVGNTVKTFESSNSNSYSIPTVLHTINYIKSFDPEVNPNSRYIITKPASSINYGSDGYDKNMGSTDTYSYLALQLPTYIVTGTPVRFNSNITEITQLGKSIQNVTAMYRNNSDSLTALTAIKDDFGWCTNIIELPNLFYDASALKEVPNSFGNMGRLTGAPSMFQNCISLTKLPDFYGLNSFKSGPAMFKNCNKVTTFPQGTLSKLTGASEMFADCTSLTGNYSDKMIPPTKWESFAPKLQYANKMFSGCSKITDIQTDLSATDIIDMSLMFAGCSAITSDIGPIMQFAKSKFIDYTAKYASAFMGCTGVKSGTSSYNDIINDPTPAWEGSTQTMAEAYWRPLFGLT